MHRDFKFIVNTADYQSTIYEIYKNGVLHKKTCKKFWIILWKGNATQHHWELKNVDCAIQKSKQC